MADLDFGRMMTFNAVGDKETTLVYGVFNGGCSLDVFVGRGAPKAKFNLGRRPCHWLIHQFEKIKRAQPGTVYTVPLTKWSPENKSERDGAISVGLDEKSQLYFGISHPNLGKAVKFLIRNGLRADLSEFDVTEQVRISIDSMLSLLGPETTAAIANTSFKREHQGGGQRRDNDGRKPYNPGPGRGADVSEDSIGF